MSELVLLGNRWSSSKVLSCRAPLSWLFWYKLSLISGSICRCTMLDMCSQFVTAFWSVRPNHVVSSAENLPDVWFQEFAIYNSISSSFLSIYLNRWVAINILHFCILNHAKMSKHLTYPMEWDIIIHPRNGQIQGVEKKTNLKFP